MTPKNYWITLTRCNFPKILNGYVTQKFKKSCLFKSQKTCNWRLFSILITKLRLSTLTVKEGQKGKRNKAKKSNEVCRDFLNGKCRRGASCKYLHDEEAKNQEAAERGNINKQKAAEAILKSKIIKFMRITTEPSLFNQVTGNNEHSKMSIGEATHPGPKSQGKGYERKSKETIVERYNTSFDRCTRISHVTSHWECNTLFNI